MRQDQIESFKPICYKVVDKIFAALFGEVGVTTTKDIIPDPDKFITGMIKSMYGEDFTEQEIDDIIEFNLKYKNKNDQAGARSEIFINEYFTNNQETIHTMLDKLQGE